MDWPNPLLRGSPAAGIRPFGRRAFLRGAGLTSTAALLAACGIRAQTTGPTTVPDRSATEKTINWSNWQGYMDVDEEDESKHPTLDAFTEQTGIKVNYTEDVNDNIEYFGKIQPQLASGAAISADVFVVTDWMVDKIIRLGYALPIDHANVPNLKNLDPALLNVDFDKGRTHSITWQSGMTGVATNPAATGGKIIESVDQLLTDPSLHGKVTLLSEMRDTVGMVLLDLGFDPGNFTEDQFYQTVAKIETAVSSGHVRRFTGNDYTQELASGDIAACIAWSGDVVQLQFDNPDIQLTLPQAGAIRWSDNFVIPIRCGHKKNVESLINYYLDPEVAAQLEAWVNYVCPVPAAKEVLAKQDPELAENELIFPSEELSKRLRGFMSLDEDLETRYNDAFNKLTGA